ncbi:hypothetical protein DFJ77DRAFT_465562 [Powellomyces hirtus]|nr:hypothetical protein DFJ77DRAFT_465562 [Powellomyces hirtus]
MGNVSALAFSMVATRATSTRPDRATTHIPCHHLTCTSHSCVPTLYPPRVPNSRISKYANPPTPPQSRYLNEVCGYMPPPYHRRFWFPQPN